MPSNAMMERSLGLKECPRCGLKNRGSARQCDFCGYDFGTSDTWMEDVQELEQINQLEKSESLDADTMTKIEATIIKTDEKKPEPEGIKKPVVIVRTKPRPKEGVREEPGAIEPSLSKQPSEAVSETETPLKVTPISSKGMKVFTANVPVEAGESPTPVSYLPPTYLVSVGSFVYVGTLVVAVTSHMSRLIGWAMVIIGALLIVAGVGWALKIRKPSATEIKEEEEVLLCPLCHEVVSKSDSQCPNCHASFEAVGTEEAA